MTNTFRDQQQYVVDNFRGLYSRKTIRENVPPGYLRQADNIVYTDKAARNRLGLNNTSTIAGLNIVRSHQYRLSATPTIQRFILLDDIGNVYDQVTVGSFAPIGNIGAGNDLSILPLFDRVFISPHNRVRGQGNLFIWEPLLFPTVTTMRLAGGSPPTTAVTAVTSATAGTIQAGIHLFAVVSETSSGFFTKYKTAFPGGFPTYTAPGGFKADLTVPFGDPGTVRRHILATKRIPSFDGNAENYEFFFIDVINDNVTAAITVDFVDSQLVDSGDYLLDQLELIPAFVQLTTYQGAMVGVGEQANSSIARVSRPGEPESFQETDGFIIVNPGEGGGLKNCSEYRGLLYLFKSFKTYSTSNNGDSPNGWPVQEVDSANGTECFGIGRIVDDFSAVTSDHLVVASRGGLYAFDGSFSGRPLSFVVDGFWSNQDFANFNKIQIFIDPINKIIYTSLGGETFLFRSMLVAFYDDGLDWQNIRWAKWTYPSLGETAVISSIGVVFGPTFIPRLFLVIYDGGSDTNLYRIDSTTLDRPGTVQLASTNPDGQPSIKHSDGGYFVAEGDGTGPFSVTAPNSVVFTVPSPTLGLNTFRWKQNLRSDYFQPSFSLAATNGTCSLNKVILLYKPIEDEIPG